MKDRCRKFTPLARQRFEEGLQKLHADVLSVQGSPMGLRPNIRSFLLAVTAGEAIHPEIVRMQMGVFVKSAVLRAEV